MIKFIRIFAVLKKQLKDTFKNKTVLIQFIIFPLIAFILTETITTGDAGLKHTYFVTLFATMYTGMVPMINMASIITEEKEKNTLRVLMMANVKPIEYLIGVGSYIFIICGIGILAFGLMGGFVGMELVKFILILMLGVLASIILGSVIGIYAKNQISASALVLPISMIASFLPMISMFNKSIEAVSKILYTQQINYLINDLSASNLTFDRFAIVISNMVIFLVVFFFAYKVKSLAE